VGISAALFQHRHPSQHGQALARPNSRTGERRDAKQRGRGGEWRRFGTRRQTEFAAARSKNIWALLDRCRELVMVIAMAMAMVVVMMVVAAVLMVVVVVVLE
jgi:hypothetical protein